MYTKEKVIEMVERLCDEAGVELTVPVSLNSRFTSTLGRVSFNSTILGVYPKSIEFSKKLIDTATDESILSVIKHEVAHYVAFVRSGEPHGHDAYFKSICAELGCTNDGVSTDVVYRDDAAPAYRYEVYCPTCRRKLPGGFSRMCKRVREIENYLCPLCKKDGLEIITNW